MAKITAKLRKQIETHYLRHGGTYKVLEEKFGVSEAVLRPLITPLRSKYKRHAVTAFITGKKTVNQLASDYSVQPKTIGGWISDPRNAPASVRECSKNSLLIGNGLNNTLRSNVKWSALMGDIGSNIGVPSNSAISNTLELERMANVALARDNGKINGKSGFYYIKQTIKNTVEKISLNSDDGKIPVHQELLSVPCDNILTTNYDLLLESVFGNAYRPAESAEDTRAGFQMSRYSFGSTGSAGDISFFHPHGTIDEVSTICIGYEHYMGIVEHLRSTYNAKSGNRQEDTAILKMLRGKKAFSDEWGELFYSTNMAILGFGLDTTEADFWWLLAHRASLFYRNVGGAKYLITNNIVYYDTYNDTTGDSKKDNLYDLLTAFHICVKKVRLSTVNYEHEKAYRVMLEDIRRNGISGPDRVIDISPQNAADNP